MTTKTVQPSIHTVFPLAEVKATHESDHRIARLAARKAFREAWQAEHRPWLPPQCFAYCKVLGPKTLGGVGSYASVSFQLFLVSLREYREFCCSTPLRCTVEILSKKPCLSPTGAKYFSVTAQINHFQDRAFFFKFPQRDIVDREHQSCDFHLPDQRYCKFHMLYDPKARTDGTYRGIVDYWIDEDSTTYDYIPPKYHLGDLLTATLHGQSHYILYTPVYESFSTLRESTELDELYVVLIMRQFYDPTTRRVRDDSVITLKVRPQRFVIDRLNPQVEQPLPVSPLDNFSEEGTDHLITANGTVFSRQTYEDFVENFDLISYSLAHDSATTRSCQSYHCSALIESVSSDISTFSSIPYQSAGLTLSDAELFAPGNLIQFHGLRWKPYDPAFKGELCYIDHILGRNLPKTGIFPYAPNFT